MPTLEIGLPLANPLWKKVTFGYLSQTGHRQDEDCGSLLYLRSSRILLDNSSVCGFLGKNPYRRQYQWQARYYAQLLAGAFGDVAFDAVLSPPSRYPFTQTFKSAFLRSGNAGEDLSDWFCREKPVYAGSGPAYQNFFRSLSCKGGTELAKLDSLLVVDDILWRGITAAALLEHLRLHGLRRQARVYLACPLWIV